MNSILLGGFFSRLFSRHKLKKRSSGSQNALSEEKSLLGQTGEGQSGVELQELSKGVRDDVAEYLRSTPGKKGLLIESKHTTGSRSLSASRMVCTQGSVRSEGERLWLDREKQVLSLDQASRVNDFSAYKEGAERYLNAQGKFVIWHQQQKNSSSAKPSQIQEGVSVAIDYNPKLRQS